MMFARCWRRECLILLRDKSQWLLPMLFMLIVLCLFPVGISNDLVQLSHMAAGMVWIASMLALMLSFHHVFAYDHQDGYMQQYVMAPGLLWRVIVTKSILHVMVVLIPMMLMLPLISIWLHIGAAATLVLLATLVLGLPTLFLIGMMIHALTLGLKQATVLTTLLLLPLSFPTLIFACGIMRRYALGQIYLPLFAILLALLLFAACVALPVTMMALRSAVGETI